MKALITGITGQDGSYLAELLLDKGYEVHGIVRRVAMEDTSLRFSRIKHLLGRITLHPGLVDDYASVYSIISRVMPDEIYHLAAQSFVAESFKDPFSVMKINVLGTLNVLEAVRNLVPKCRMYNAASSEMYGKVYETPQKETTKFYPRSPYGVSKVAAFDLVRNYRESYGLFCCSGILYNHTSVRRGFEFITRKVSSTVAKIAHKLTNELCVGNMESKRDWGLSSDYVKAMWLMLQHNIPDDYVIATNETHTIKELIEIAFKTIGLDYKNYVVVDPQFYRPAEVDILQGDYSKAKKVLGWEPTTSFENIVRSMVMYDISLITLDKNMDKI